MVGLVIGEARGAQWWSGSPGTEGGARLRRLVWRARFEPFWRYCPQLVVLAAVPGSGKRTWMLQCDQYTREHLRGVSVLWATSDDDLAALLDQDHLDRPGARSARVFVDARLLTEDFWVRLQTTLAERSWAQAIVCCFDKPRLETMGELGEGAVILDEAALCFDSVEESLVDAALRSEHGNLDVPVMDQREKGFPYLVGDRIERSISANWAGTGTLSHVGTEIRVLELLEKGPGSYPFSLSRTGRVLRATKRLRWFTPEFLVDLVDDAREASEIVSRLSTLPLFDARPNAETNTLMCVWRERAWDYLTADEDADEARRRLTENLQGVRAVGIVTGQLSFLLSLGRMTEAEELVRRNFRRFLVRIDPRSAQIVREDNRIDGSVTPTLTLLRCALQARELGIDPAVRARAVRAVSRLQSDREGDIVTEVGRTGLLIFGEMLAGRRAALKRQTKHLFDLLEQIEALPHRDLRRKEPFSASGPQAATLRCSLYLAHFSALQADLFREAVLLGEALTRWDDPEDTLHWVDQISAGGTADLAGLRSLSPAGTRPEDDLFYQGESQLDIEEGRDAEAIAALRPVLAQHWSAASRTAINGLVTQVYALVAPGELTERGLGLMLCNSRRLWDDGRPSSFLVWNAVQAFATLGALDSAREWVARIGEVDDLFSSLARATLALWQGDGSAVLAALDREREVELPRMMVIAGVLEASAHLLNDDRPGAAQSLEGLWREYPYPRLLRYALRFIPQGIFDQLRDSAACFPISLETLFAEAANDSRASEWVTRPKLTPSEQDILQLMRLGLTNREIAERRFVTIGTLRSQLKALYRKLGAGDRGQALQVASRFQLLDS